MRWLLKTLFVVLVVLTAWVIGIYANAVTRPAMLVSSTVSDGSVYLATARWILDGCPAGFKSQNTALPIGYPLLIAGLSKCGLAGESGLIGLNYACLAVSLIASWSILRRAFGLSVPAGWTILLFIAASDVCRELSVTIASEMVFLAASLITLVLLDARDASFDWPRCAGMCRRNPDSHGWRLAHPSSALGRRGLPVSQAVAEPSNGPARCGWCLLVVFLIARMEYVSRTITGRYHAGADWNSIATQQFMKMIAIGELFTFQRAEDYRLAYRSEFVFGGGAPARPDCCRLLVEMPAMASVRRLLRRIRRDHFRLPVLWLRAESPVLFPGLAAGGGVAFSGFWKIWIATRLRSVRPVSER